MEISRGEMSNSQNKSFNIAEMSSFLQNQWEDQHTFLWLRCSHRGLENQLFGKCSQENITPTKILAVEGSFCQVAGTQNATPTKLHYIAGAFFRIYWRFFGPVFLQINCEPLLQRAVAYGSYKLQTVHLLFLKWFIWNSCKQQKFKFIQKVKRIHLKQN